MSVLIIFPHWKLFTKKKPVFSLYVSASLIIFEPTDRFLKKLGMNVMQFEDAQTLYILIISHRQPNMRPCGHLR